MINIIIFILILCLTIVIVYREDTKTDTEIKRKSDATIQAVGGKFMLIEKD